LAGRKHRTSVDDGPPPGVVIGAPGVFEGYVRRHMWVFYVLFLVSPLLAMMVFGLSIGLATLFVPPLIMVGLLLGTWVVVRQRELRTLRAMRFRRCLICRYDLSASPEEGICPECGVTYEGKMLEKSWRYTYDEVLEAEGTGD
jgi:hypothetical protein